MEKDNLQKAGRNRYGFVDVNPGTDMARRLMHVSESTKRRYIRLGWIKKVGTGLVLTMTGYEHV